MNKIVLPLALVARLEWYRTPALLLLLLLAR